MNRILAILLLARCLVCLGQTPEEKQGATKSRNTVTVTFHVTSVAHNEDGQDAIFDGQRGIATIFRVYGYTDGTATGARIEYVLTCTQILVYKPSPHIAFSCGSVHAGDVYNARLMDDAINFWPAEKYRPPPFRAAYTIVSEREVNQGR